MTSVIQFRPWVGQKYDTQSTKIMILGESHHEFNDEKNGENITIKTLNDYINADQHCAWHDYFTKISRIFRGREYEINFISKNDFWNSVLFYNYIQEIVDDHGHGARPTPEMWITAEPPFREVISTYRPTHIIVTGVCLWWHVSGGRPITDVGFMIPWTSSPTSGFARAIGIVHPSGGMSYAVNGERVREFLTQPPVA